MKLKLLILAILINITNSFCDYHFILPVFYNKNDNNFYGLFIRDHGNWAPIKVVSNLWEYNKYKITLITLLKDNFNVLFGGVLFNENNIFDLNLRTASVYFIPVRKFVPASALNQSTNDEFAWLDLNQFIGNRSGSITIGNETYHIKDEEFTHHFGGRFKSQYLKSKQAKKYIDLMEQTTQEPMAQEPISQKPSTKITTEPSKRRVREEIYYPKNVKDEYKFFHDAYFNAPHALSRDIEIAKQAGTTNDTIFSQGTYHTPLTYALYKRSDKSSPETIEILLRNGVDPNAPDSDGFTPLYYAIKIEHDPEIIRLLLDYAADRDVIIQGRSLLDLETREDVRKMLQSYTGGTREPEVQPVTQPFVMKPSIPAVPSYENGLENNIQQLKNALMQLRQELV